jgi:hypothetical protein
MEISSSVPRIEVPNGIIGLCALRDALRERKEALWSLPESLKCRGLRAPWCSVPLPEALPI